MRLARKRIITQGIVILALFLLLGLQIVVVDPASGYTDSSYIAFEEYHALQLTDMRRNYRMDWSFNVDYDDCAITVLLFTQDNFLLWEPLSVYQTSLVDYTILSNNSIGSDAGQYIVPTTEPYFIVFVHTDENHFDHFVNVKYSVSLQNVRARNTAVILTVIFSTMAVGLFAVISFRYKLFQPSSTKSTAVEVAAKEGTSPPKEPEKVPEKETIVTEYSCSNCNSPIPGSAIDCPSCSQRVVCSVCGRALSSTMGLVACPLCKHVGHINHLSDWLKDHKRCPFCRKKVRKQELLLVKEKTVSEN